MLKRVWEWYGSLSSRVKTSVAWSAAIVGLISTVMSVAGVTLDKWNGNVWIDVGIVAASYVGFFFIVFFAIGRIFKDSVSLVVSQTPVSISCGDIFDTPGWRVIGCDTHFNTRVDDVVISKRSLHGRLVLEHGKKWEIVAAVEKAARRLGLPPDDSGLYDFPLGSIVRYDSSVDNETYLLVAMAELDDNYESHTNMAKFEQMLMTMWREIGRVYASHDIVLPLLGAGITRFDGGPKNREMLLRCMLCTLSGSGVLLNADISVVLYEDARDIPLYEYKDMFKSLQGR